MKKYIISGLIGMLLFALIIKYNTVSLINAQVTPTPTQVQQGAIDRLKTGNLSHKRQLDNMFLYDLVINGDKNKYLVTITDKYEPQLENGVVEVDLVSNLILQPHNDLVHFFKHAIVSKNNVEYLPHITKP